MSISLSSLDVVEVRVMNLLHPPLGIFACTVKKDDKTFPAMVHAKKGESVKVSKTYSVSELPLKYDFSTCII